MEKDKPHQDPDIWDVNIGRKEKRTIGIDIFSWEFNNSSDDGKQTKFQVGIWDLAGQNAYQTSHSIFNSKRTMYLVRVDLKAYKDILEREQLVSASGMANAAMEAFVDQNIYRWVRGICAREPESEFVSVGTKSDLIDQDTTTAEIIMSDLLNRLHRKEDRELKTIRQACNALKKEYEKLGTAD